jgi:hypothetical protein
MQRSRVKNVFDVHTSKASERLKVAQPHLWRGFICLALGDFYTVKLAPKYYNVLAPRTMQ